MKGVVVSELVLVLALMGCLYLLWIHDEQLRDLEAGFDRLRLSVGELADAKPAPKPRASRKPSTNGKAD